MSLQYNYVGRKARFSTDPGRLDRRVELQFPIAARDSTGGVALTWFEAAEVWAAKRFDSGRRLYAAEAKHFESMLVYRIRHRADVREGWRLVAGDDVFEIVSVEELGRRHLLDLTVRGIDQTPGDALAGFLLHEGSPFVLEGGGFFALHREEDLAA